MKILEIFKRDLKKDVSLLTDINQESLGRERNILMFNNLMKEASYILNNSDITGHSIHPIFSFIKQITDYLTLESSLEAYVRNDLQLPRSLEDIFIAADIYSNFKKIEQTLLVSPHNDDIDYYKDSGYKIIPLDFSINLSNSPIIINPWKIERTSDALIGISIESNKFDAKRYSGNIINHYYYPLGCTICFNGNHSQYSAKLKGTGTTIIKEIVNIESLYKYVTFDGTKFIYNFPNDEIEMFPKEDEIKNMNEFYGGVLFEVGRMLIERKELFPEEVIQAIWKKEDK